MPIRIATCGSARNARMNGAPSYGSRGGLAGAGVRDSNGNLLADGASVVVITDLKVKGSSSVVKGGTKVRNIRLTEATDGHNIACKIDGIGAMNLKSEFVKK